MTYRVRPFQTNICGEFSITFKSLFFCFAMAITPFLAVGQPAWIPEGSFEARAAENAQALALRETEEMFADPVLQDLIEEQLLEIYAADPSLAAAGATRESLSSIFVHLIAGVQIDAVLAQFPAEWQATAEVAGPFATIHFGVGGDGVEIAQWTWANVDGIHFAEADYPLGPSGDVVRHADENLYVFSLGSVECPSGCLDTERRYVVWQPDAVVEVPYDALGTVFNGGMPEQPLTQLRAALGDTIALPYSAHKPETGIQPVSLSVVPVSAPEALVLDGEEDFGTWSLEIPRPYSLETIVHTFEIAPRGGAPMLSGNRHLNGWLEHKRLGLVWDQFYPWVWHPVHHWIYIEEVDGNASDAWAYDEKIGWIYVKGETYPWVHADGAWLYYVEGTASPRLFYDVEKMNFRSFE